MLLILLLLVQEKHIGCGTGSVRFGARQAKILRPATHHTRGRVTKIRPRPAPQRAGPKRGNRVGDHMRGPAWGTATASRRYLRFPAFFCGAPSGALQFQVNAAPAMRISGVC